MVMRLQTSEGAYRAGTGARTASYCPLGAAGGAWLQQINWRKSRRQCRSRGGDSVAAAWRQHVGAGAKGAEPGCGSDEESPLMINKKTSENDLQV